MKKKWLFYHDFAPAHTTAVATVELVELDHEQLPHTPYFQDLAPSDYFCYQALDSYRRIGDFQETFFTDEFKE